MDDSAPLPSPWREAVDALDAGDLTALGALLAAHPDLAHDRAEWGEGYFAHPYLLWFVAGNPVRGEKLPANVGEAARTILRAARERPGADLRPQVDGALGLVASGRVARESGVQGELIDLLADAGADLDAALPAALAHRETAAAERLMALGARLTLAAAAATGRAEEAGRLFAPASSEERRIAVAAAALHGQADVLATLIARGAEVGAYGPPGFHPHATPLHHAVDAGSLDAVRALVEAGVSLDTKDHAYGGTPLGWAEHLGRPEIAAYLRERASSA